MSLTVTIEEEAKDFMNKKGNTLTISRADVRSCCFVYEDVDVKFKVPKANKYNTYEHIEQEGFSIFVQKGLYFKDDKLSIGMTGKGLIRSIYIDGLARN